jgi:hypothetical protein
MPVDGSVAMSLFQLSKALQCGDWSSHGQGQRHVFHNDKINLIVGFELFHTQNVSADHPGRLKYLFFEGS